MTEALDRKLRAALRDLEQVVPAAVRDASGLALPANRERAEKTLRKTLEAAAQALADRPAKPVLRTLHHLACTGGTVISKAVSAQPNVTLLSEVDPFSPMGHAHPFRPTDMIGLAKLGSRAASVETQARLFRANLDVLVEENEAQGSYLVLRDHSHGKYTYGEEIGTYPGLRALLNETYDLRSVVTVRDPIDSYLSLRNNGWDLYTPAGFDEYCRRMLVFLDDHAEVPVIRYEDFVTDPQEGGAALCEALDLPFNPDFPHLMPAISLSGDSGRKGEKLELRPRREIPEEVLRDIENSPCHAPLAERLGYPTIVGASA
jgi:hypothetical protein